MGSVNGKQRSDDVMEPCQQCHFSTWKHKGERARLDGFEIASVEIHAASSHGGCKGDSGIEEHGVKTMGKGDGEA